MVRLLLLEGRVEPHNSILAPALVGNVVVWKPSPAATYSNYIVHQIFSEAGIPPGVIQFVPGPPPEVCAQVLSHKSFAGLHFTGSTFIFKKLWKDIAANLDVYKGYPRIVGETGGKNFHIVHESAEIKNAVLQTIRGAFEYSGSLRFLVRRILEFMRVLIRPKMFCAVPVVCLFIGMEERVQRPATGRSCQDPCWKPARLE